MSFSLGSTQQLPEYRLLPDDYFEHEPPDCPDCDTPMDVNDDGICECPACHTLLRKEEEE